MAGGRQRIDTPGLVPLALEFDADLRGPEHEVSRVGWTDMARSVLRELDDRLRPRRLPIEALRGRLEVHDPENLRLDRSLGLRGWASVLIWSVSAPTEAVRRAAEAVLGWTVEDLGTGAEVGAAGERLRALLQQGQLFVVERSVAPVFAWGRSAGGSAVLEPTNPNGYADLADFVVRRLEGAELFPGCGPMRRVAGGRLDSNRAELMTDPVPAMNPPFCLVVRVEVLTFPGRPTPVVALHMSRRLLARALRGAAVRRLTCYALPDTVSTALQFGLRRDRRDSTFFYRADADFAPIARRYGLDVSMEAADMAAGGQGLHGCRLLVPHVHGVGERLNANSGVPDTDKLTAWHEALVRLEPHGLRAWTGLTDVASPTKAVQSRNQRWRDRDETHAQAFSDWQKEASEDLLACYSGRHQMVIGYDRAAHADAERVRRWLSDTLAGRVAAEIIPLPSDVHGPRHRLPGGGDASSQRAEQRAQAWKPFVKEVQRYIRETDTRVDGILVLAPEWYEGGHDDRVNKRTGRITLARSLGVPVQYLRPVQEEGQRLPRNQDPSQQFDTRTMAAWLDLAWKTLGRVNPDKVARGLGEIYADAHVRPPGHVLGVGVLRRNRTPAANARSFVPFAVELDLETGLCSARFGRNRDGRFEATARAALPSVLVELAASGPLSPTDERTRRRERLAELSQLFFDEVITEFCQRVERPLVMIDAATCRDVWPWVADSRLNPDNVILNGHPHAEVVWGNARIVRIRVDNAPKVLIDSHLEGQCAESGEAISYSAPRWAEARLIRVADSSDNAYLSFGSLLRTNLIRGSSCYRSVVGLGSEKGSPRRWTKRIISPFTGAWTTPTGLEITVIKAHPNESPDLVAQVVEWLRTVYVHVGDWTAKPAPLHFESTLKEYLADYDLEESEAGDDDEAENGDDTG